MRKFVIAAMVAATALLALGAYAPASANESATKWYVCKYVGPPGSGEVLQTGDNPIFVDENAIDTSPVFIGATFSDKQSHSLVIAGPFDGPLEVEPTCPGDTPPRGEASTFLSEPTCPDPTIRATGTNLTDLDEVTFDLFNNGVFVGSFVVGNGLQGQSDAFDVDNGDVITVTLHGGELILATRVIELTCQGGGGGGGGGSTACPGKIVVGNWYGDPRVNIILTGAGTFVVSGGIQRTTDLRKITKTLPCNESFRIGRYKVSRGHYLNISMDGVRIVHVKPPVLH